MRIARFTHGGSTRLGLVDGDTVIGVCTADPSLPTDLGAVLAAGTRGAVGATATAAGFSA